ncbi:MAG TPA: rhodanese-like domain-containing protein [Acidiferrobacteraceae bacterium]|nr:rhodanese-like domain-containing protein [Acidiferrobacteraceae bacterium]
MRAYQHHARYIAQLIGAVLLYALSSHIAAQEKGPVYECPAEPTAQKDVRAKVLASLEKTTPKTRDAKGLISAHAVRLKQGAGQPMVLVDVRSTEAFAQVRIPGALNIPLYALRTKSFLKSQHIVLVDTGAAYDALAKTASRLKTAGFKTVSILDGGMNAWRRAKGPTVGNPLAQQRLMALTPQQYFTERDYDHWLMVDISSAKTQAQTKLFANTIKVPYHKDEQRFLSALKKKLAKRKAKGKTFVVLVDEEGINNQRLAALANDLDNAQVFYLDGGLKAYGNFYQSQKTLMLAQAKGNPGPKQRCQL